MTLREVYEKCEKFCEKAKQHPKFWISIFILLAVILLIWLPPWRVSHFEINNATVEADLENQYRATLAQILGGVAIGITLYYTWRRITIAEEDLKATQETLKIAQEGQITERFTRAIEQLGALDLHGNPAIEIRLGAIYALERIANESEKDYWPIMEILTAYVRKNSRTDVTENKNISLLSIDIQANESKQKEISETEKITLDIQAVLTVLGRRKNSFNFGESNHLNLRRTCLKDADLFEVHLEEASLTEAHLERADIRKAHLEGAYLIKAHLEDTYLMLAHLERSRLIETHLERANLQGADFHLARLRETNLQEANLRGAKNLTAEQLSKVKTLYKAELDPELEIPLREKYPALFEEPDIRFLKSP